MSMSPLKPLRAAARLGCAAVRLASALVAFLLPKASSAAPSPPTAPSEHLAAARTPHPVSDGAQP